MIFRADPQTFPRRAGTATYLLHDLPFRKGGPNSSNGMRLNGDCGIVSVKLRLLPETERDLEMLRTSMNPRGADWGPISMIVFHQTSSR